MKKTLSMLTRILAICSAVCALAAAVLAALDYLNELDAREKHYTEFPPEYDDYADWEE